MAQVGCMRQVLGPGALGRPRGIGWRGRWEGGLGWGIHVTPWLIHVNVWQNPLQYCKVISLQLIKINEKKKHIQTFLLLSFFLSFPSFLPPSLSSSPRHFMNLPYFGNFFSRSFGGVQRNPQTSVSYFSLSYKHQLIRCVHLGFWTWN